MRIALFALRIVLLAVVAALFKFGMLDAQAMTVSPLKSLTNTDQTITPVRGGCGRGYHRHRGRCRPN